MNKPEALLSVQNLQKSFISGRRELKVLRGISFECGHNELLAIMGPSGCGKTTLLNLISGLDRVDDGDMIFKGKSLTSQTPDQWDRFRRTNLAMIFQFNQLLPEFSALENTYLPALIAKDKADTWDGEKIEMAMDFLQRLGLEDRVHHRPSQLSGGEQQRVAIARALMNQPDLILADEPTGSLDAESGLRVFGLLRQLQQELGFSCLLVTHNREIADRCDRIISLYSLTS